MGKKVRKAMITEGHMIRSKKNVIIGMMAVFILISSFFIIDVNAAEVPETTYEITGITLTDYSGNPLGADISKDSEVRITYTFTVDNATGDTINAGDTFSYDLPDEIFVSYIGSISVYDGEKIEENRILTATAGTDNTLIVEFTDYSKTHSGVNGSYSFDYSFNSSNIGSGDPVDILFPIDAYSGTITKSVDFAQPIITPTINKSGVYNSATKQITWTLTANSEDTAIDNMQIIDALSQDHEFVSGSATLNGIFLADGDIYDSAIGCINYSYTDQVTTEQVLAFVTEANPDYLLYAKADYLTISNSAILYDNGTPIYSPAITVNVPVDTDGDGVDNSTDTDDDDDGFSDAAETLHNSDPYDSSSTPVDTVTIYVDCDAAGSSSGTDWTNAFTGFEPAINYSISGDEIWVAAGTYKPSSWPNGGSSDREMHFTLKNGVSVCGGFDGTETLMDERDAYTNTTILSGDIGTGDDASDNCYHVFYHPSGTDLDDTATLDGVTITGGNADGDNDNAFGAGMLNNSSSPTLTNCIISSNSAGFGGGMYNYDSSSPTLTNCTISSNSAEGYGSGMCNEYYSSPTLTNCTISRNSAEYYGGGMYNHIYSSPTLTNCILWGDTAATSGSEIYNDGSSSTPDFSYCDIEESNGSGTSWDSSLGTDSGNNIDADPFFSDEANSDFHLTVNSPCIDTGNSSAGGLSGVDTDIDGEARIIGAAVDMGADEFPDTDGDGVSDRTEDTASEGDGGGGGCFIETLGSPKQFDWKKFLTD